MLGVDRIRIVEPWAREQNVVILLILLPVVAVVGLLVLLLLVLLLLLQLVRVHIQMEDVKQTLITVLYHTYQDFVREEQVIDVVLMLGVQTQPVELAVAKVIVLPVALHIFLDIAPELRVTVAAQLQ